MIAWHRRSFRLVWRRKSLAGRPTTRAEIHRLIRQMAQKCLLQRPDGLVHITLKKR